MTLSFWVVIKKEGLAHTEQGSNRFLPYTFCYSVGIAARGAEICVRKLFPSPQAYVELLQVFVCSLCLAGPIITAQIRDAGSDSEV